MKPNAILYCRVSDKSQADGQSIKLQPPMLKEFATKNGYSVYRVFIDVAKSGTSTDKRDGLWDALNLIEKENKDKNKPRIQAFIVQDTDRLARNEKDHYLIRAHLKKYGVILLSKNQPGINDSAEGLLLDTLMAGVNAFQSRLTGRKVRNTVSMMAENGLTTHKAPLGYLNRQREEGGKTIKYVEKDPDKSKLVLQMFRLYSKGLYSLHALAKYMNKRGLTTTGDKPLQASGLSEIMNNRYYLGKIKHNGKEFQGKHPRLISDALFKQCAKILEIQRNHASRRRKPKNTKLFYLKDVLKCGSCGYRVTGGGSKGRDHMYNYYYCGRLMRDPKYHSKKGNCVNLPEIHAEIQDFFGLLELTPDIVEEVKMKAAQILSETHGDMDGERAEIQRNLTRLDHQRKKLEGLWLADEVVEDYYNRNHKTIEAEITAAEQRLLEISGLRTDRTTMFEALVRLARDLPAAYEKANPEVKRMYLKIFWECFEIGGGTVQKAVPSKVVTALIHEKLINLKANSQNRKFLVSKVWLPRLDSNQQPIGYTLPFCFQKEWTISSPI
ncbi:MAG: recombinase family protein [Candidatus Peribacter sp.]|nr:recombinase family protein [Candidatus Peribacter sp.]